MNFPLLGNSLKYMFGSGKRPFGVLVLSTLMVGDYNYECLKQHTINSVSFKPGML
jgi:phage-related holin